MSGIGANAEVPPLVGRTLDSGYLPAAEPRLRLSWPEVGVLFLFALAMTYAAWLARPTWDDGWMDLIHAKDFALRDLLGDRPTYGAFLSWLQDRGILWPAHAAMHFVGWFSQGLAAMIIWSLFFPTLPRLRLVAGCLAIAPVICQYQMVVIGGIIYLIQVAIVYAAFTCTYFIFRNGGKTLWKGLAVLAIALAVFFSTLITEYTVPASVVAGLLLWFLLGHEGRSMPSRLVATGLLPACTLAGYVVYYVTVDAAVRGDVRPEKVLSGAGGVLQLAGRTIAYLADELWQLSLGRLLSSLSAIQFHPTLEAMWILGFAVVATVTIAAASLRLRATGNAEELQTSKGFRTAGVFLLALAAGLLPAVLLGRYGTVYRMETRYWLPVLPVASCLTVLLIRTCVRERLTYLVVTMLAFASAYTAIATATAEIRTATVARAWGEVLRGMLTPDGMNVALFMYDAPDVKRAHPVERAYELTARLTSDWPVEDRNRFWAWAAPLGGNEVPNAPGELGIAIRGTLRSGPVRKFLWISIDESGRMRRVLERSPLTDHWSSPAL